MTAKVRFDYFTCATGRFIKSEYEDITFENLEILQELIDISARMRGERYNDDVCGHVMEIC